MKSIPYLWHPEQDKVCLQEKQVEARHRLAVKLDLMDEHVDEHISKLKEEPMSKIRAKLHNEMFLMWEIMFSMTNAGHA